MYCRSLLACLLLLSGCARQQTAAQARRTAILRFENLSSDPALDWVGRGLSEAVIRETNSIPSAAYARVEAPFATHISTAPGLSAERGAALFLGATHIVSGYYSTVGGQLIVNATEEDTGTRKIKSLTAFRGTPLAAAQALSQQLVATPTPLAVHGEEAFREYALGVDATGSASFSHFEKAVALDPNFGAAYLAWSRAALAATDRPMLDRVLASAALHHDAFQPLDRAYLNLQAATLTQDATRRIAAWAALVKLTPGDAPNLRALADAELAARHLPDAATHFAQASALNPADVDLLNTLAYARAYAGDTTGALAAIGLYKKQRPEDPNALDSEGDILLYSGKLAQAAQAYEAGYAKDPNFNLGLDGWKAARARLYANDKAAAAKLFAQYAAARQSAKDPLLPFRQAEWAYLTGNRPAAVATLLAAARSTPVPAIRSLCLTQASIWTLLAGDRATAAQHAEAALKPTVPATFANAVIARFLAQPTVSAAEWRTRADRQLIGAGADKLRKLAVAYALLLSREYAEAVPAWKEIYEASAPSDQAPGYLYAFALKQAGLQPDAKYTAGFSIPASGPAVTFEAIYADWLVPSTPAGTPASAK